MRLRSHFLGVLQAPHLLRRPQTSALHKWGGRSMGGRRCEPAAVGPAAAGGLLEHMGILVIHDNHT